MTLREVLIRTQELASGLTPNEMAKLAGHIMEDAGTDDEMAGAFITGLGVESACELTRHLNERLNIRGAKR